MDKTNENKKEISSKASLLFLLPIIVCIILICFTGLSKKKDKSVKLKLYTEETQAEVIDYQFYQTTHNKSELTSKNKFHHIISIEYTIDNKVYHNTREYVGPSDALYKKGDKITIYYNKDDVNLTIPKEIYDFEKEGNERLFIAIALMVFMILVATSSKKTVKRIA